MARESSGSSAVRSELRPEPRKAERPPSAEENEGPEPRGTTPRRGSAGISVPAKAAGSWGSGSWQSPEEGKGARGEARGWKSPREAPAPPSPRIRSAGPRRLRAPLCALPLAASGGCSSELMCWGFACFRRDMVHQHREQNSSNYFPLHNKFLELGNYPHWAECACQSNYDYQ